MIREMLTAFILIIVLAAVCGSFTIIQKNTAKQFERIEKCIEEENAFNRADM